METRTMRTRLLLGDEGVAKLQRAKVMVVGCGAVGSYAIEALARGGIGHLKLVDFDVVSVSNINRQLFALNSTVGKKKTDVAKARIKDISSDILVDTYDLFLDEKNASEVLRDVDFVVDAIDSRDSKIALYKVCQEKGIPFVSSMGAALRLSTDKIKIALMKKTSVCPLAGSLRPLCKKNGIAMDFPVVFSTETPAKGSIGHRQMGSLSTVPAIFGLMMAHFVIKKIVGLE